MKNQLKIERQLFEKYYTRSLSLAAAQSWWQGEHEILPKLTEEAVYFNPLFIFTETGRADVYYDSNNPGTDEEKIIDFFSHKPEKFEVVMKQYVDVCLKLTKIPKEVEMQDLKSYFSFCASFSAFLAVILELGDMRGEDIIARRLGLKAYHLREKTQRVGEATHKKLAEMLVKIRPEMKEFGDVLMFEEATGAKHFNAEELPKRKYLFIYFENDLYFSIRDLEKKKNIKISRKEVNMATKKSWIEKLNDSKDLPKVVTLAPNAVEHWHGETMTVPAPLEVDEIMRRVPEGKLITINEIRQKLAKKHHTDIGCPLTSGIFAWIVANAAEEMREKWEISDEDITPWWRTLKSGGFLNEKFPSGPDMQKKLLEGEGHKVVQKGKKLQVDDFESKIVEV